MSITSSSYFATIRPAPGFIVPESHEDLENFIRRNARSAVISVEKTGHATHVHLCFITNAPRRKDSVFRSLRTLVSKHYLNAQIDLKIAVSEGAYFYTIKDGNIVFRWFEDDILQYIEDDSARSTLVVEELTTYKKTVKYYAYSNKATWQPFFNRLHADRKSISVSQWQSLIFKYQGTLASSQFVWDLYYKLYIDTSNGLSEKVDKTFGPYLQAKRAREEDKDDEVYKEKRFKESETEESEQCSSDESCSDSDDGEQDYNIKFSC